MTCRVTVRRTIGFVSVTGGVCEDGGVTEPLQPDAPEMRDVHSWHFPRLIIAWFLTAVIGLLVTLLVPTEDRFPWLVFAIGAILDVPEVPVLDADPRFVLVLDTRALTAREAIVPGI